MSAVWCSVARVRCRALTTGSRVWMASSREISCGLVEMAVLEALVDAAAPAPAAIFPRAPGQPRIGEGLGGETSEVLGEMKLAAVFQAVDHVQRALVADHGGAGELEEKLQFAAVRAIERPIDLSLETARHSVRKTAPPAVANPRRRHRTRPGHPRVRRRKPRTAADRAGPVRGTAISASRGLQASLSSAAWVSVVR